MNLSIDVYLKLIRQFANYKYKFVKFINSKHAIILEVGIGNNSPRIFKHLYPSYTYHGIDKDLLYNLDNVSISKVDKFFKIDLQKSELNEIPDCYYDFIIVAHVIEHLNNGLRVIEKLCNKVKRGGYLYIEFPREESKKFPSMRGTLNFYDDPTHKNTYPLNEVLNIISSYNFNIIKRGVKRDKLRIIGLPFMIIKSKLQLGYIRGSTFWDILGFANYILAQKL